MNTKEQEYLIYQNDFRTFIKLENNEIYFTNNDSFEFIRASEVHEIYFCLKDYVKINSQNLESAYSKFLNLN